AGSPAPSGPQPDRGRGHGDEDGHGAEGEGDALPAGAHSRSGEGLGHRTGWTSTTIDTLKIAPRLTSSSAVTARRCRSTSETVAGVHGWPRSVISAASRFWSRSWKR